jgi:ankyrin repeat protein
VSHDVRTVEKLLNNDRSLSNTKDAVESPVLMSAVFWAKGRTEIILLLLDHGADPNGVDGLGKSALQEAASFRDSVPIVTLLLDRGADVNHRDHFRKTPLMAAVSAFGSPEMINLLLARGAEINAKDKFGRTAVDLLSPNWPNHARVRQLLLQNGGKAGNEI